MLYHRVVPAQCCLYANKKTATVIREAENFFWGIPTYDWVCWLLLKLPNVVEDCPELTTDRNAVIKLQHIPPLLQSLRLQILHINKSFVAILPPPVYLWNWYMIFEEMAYSIETLAL
jgi:hypothetical protein